MTTPTIDWNEVWRKAHSEKHIPVHDPKFWNKRAPEFTRNATGSDYIGQLMSIMKPEPDWSVLDVGCAAGTLAVPLASAVRTITALDPSTTMLSLLVGRCGEQGITNIKITGGRWEDDWERLGIGVHDVAIASRSLIVDDLQGAILKLEKHAARRIDVSALVDDGPFDRRIVEATGRQFHPGPDYIIVYNLLRQMGIYANVAFTVHREDKTFRDLEDALDSMRWMVYEMTPDEEERLRHHIGEHLVREDGRWKMPYLRTTRWAVMWWDKA
jgi:SAM-dependent methyltransferase